MKFFDHAFEIKTKRSGFHELDMPLVPCFLGGTALFLIITLILTVVAIKGKFVESFFYMYLISLPIITTVFSDWIVMFWNSIVDDRAEGYLRKFSSYTEGSIEGGAYLTLCGYGGFLMFVSAILHMFLATIPVITVSIIVAVVVFVSAALYTRRIKQKKVKEE